MVAEPENDGPDLAEENDGELTSAQERAILVLLNEPTLKRAAETVEVGQRTLFRWLRQPAFSRAYRQARREAFGKAIALMQHYAPLAVNTLAQVMMDPQAPHHAKVSAATSMLRFGREGIELDDLAARVEALEQASPPPGRSSSRWAS